MKAINDQTSQENIFHNATMPNKMVDRLRNHTYLDSVRVSLSCVLIGGNHAMLARCVIHLTAGWLLWIISLDLCQSFFC